MGTYAVAQTCNDGVDASASPDAGDAGRVDGMAEGGATDE